MFNNYKIVEKNGEKILILYIDSFYEFGIDFRKNNNNSNMKNEIKKIIRKINFTGEKIALMLGGIMLATILVFENPKISNNLDLVYVTDNILSINQVQDNKKESKTIENNKIEDTIVLENVTKDKKVEEKNEKTIEKNVENMNVIEKEEIKEKEKVVENVTPFKQLITVYRKNGSVLELELEDYLIGVVASEMPASFNMEALKAQAIISRTYTLKSIEIGRRLTDDVSTQTYKDNSELKEMWGSSYEKYYSKVRDAVLSTDGLAIYYNNKYIDAVFHSTSNGKTEDASYVWKNSVPYLKSVDSHWDIDSSSYLRSEEKDLDNVLNILGVNSNSFDIVSRDDSGRVLEIKVGDKSYSGVEFRNLLGLRSADFDIEIMENKLKITTRGYGHGVGLSQYGANGMAKAGYNFTDIIKHYYSDVEIK